MKKMTYEAAVAELEELVTRIEDPERDLSGISSDVKRAMELIKWCKASVKGSQEELDKLLKEE